MKPYLKCFIWHRYLDGSLSFEINILHNFILSTTASYTQSPLSSHHKLLGVCCDWAGAPMQILYSPVLLYPVSSMILPIASTQLLAAQWFIIASQSRGVIFELWNRILSNKDRLKFWDENGRHTIKFTQFPLGGAVSVIFWDRKSFYIWSES